MGKQSLSICSDCAAEVVKCDLISARDILISDLKRREEGIDDCGIFFREKRKDISEIKKHIKAFDLVIQYYSVQK